MEKTIITISRQYGSNGRNIGKALAKQLSIPYYDKELLYIAAEKSNIHPDIAEDADENVKTGFFGMFSAGPYMAETGMGVNNDLPLNDRLYTVQSNLIKELAEQGSCVIVGRCADYILADNPNTINVFVHAKEEQRIEKIASENNVSAKDAKKLMEKTDKRRATYYNYYSSNKWGRADNYHLSIDSCIGTDNCVNLIKSYIDMFSGTYN